MNAYLVRIPEERESHAYGEPPEPWTPVGVFVAATAAQAKRLALDAWTQQSSSGVNSDDWVALRVRLLGRDVAAPRGEVVWAADRDLHDVLWGRVHEILDHEGRACDCEREEALVGG